MAILVIRLDFIVDEDDDDDCRKTLSRNIPAPIRHIVNPTTYEDFCTNIEQVFLRNNANRNKILVRRIMGICFDFSMWVLFLLLVLKQFEVSRIVRITLLYILWGCMVVELVLFIYLICTTYSGRVYEYQIYCITKLCNAMTRLHREPNTKFKLKSVTKSDGEGRTYQVVSHIEVHIVTERFIPSSDYLIKVKIIPGSSRKEPSRIDRTLQPILEQGCIDRGTYASFLDRMDSLLVLLHNAKQRPFDGGLLFMIIICILLFSIVVMGASENPNTCIVVLVILCMREYSHYVLHVYETQRKSGKKSKTDVVKDIRTLLDDEMSSILPNVSFHIQPPEVEERSWEFDVIHIYVSPFPTSNRIEDDSSEHSC